MFLSSSLLYDSNFESSPFQNFAPGASPIPSSFYGAPTKGSRIVVFALNFFGTIFTGFHCLGWNFTYPTPFKQHLWCACRLLFIRSSSRSSMVPVRLVLTFPALYTALKLITYRLPCGRLSTFPTLTALKLRHPNAISDGTLCHIVMGLKHWRKLELQEMLFPSSMGFQIPWPCCTSSHVPLFYYSNSFPFPLRNSLLLFQLFALFRNQSPTAFLPCGRLSTFPTFSSLLLYSRFGTTTIQNINFKRFYRSFHLLRGGTFGWTAVHAHKIVVDKQPHIIPNKVRFNGLMLDPGLNGLSLADKSKATGAPLLYCCCRLIGQRAGSRRILWRLQRKHLCLYANPNLFYSQPCVVSAVCHQPTLLSSPHMTCHDYISSPTLAVSPTLRPLTGNRMNCLGSLSQLFQTILDQIIPYDSRSSVLSISSQVR